MATLNKLTNRNVETAKQGRHSDGGGLYLNVTKTGSRTWIYLWRGKRWRTSSNPTGMRQMGLGTYPAVSLSRARELAADYRSLIADGIDPKTHRDNEREQLSSKTFGEAGHEYIEKNKRSWRSEIHIHQWRKTVDDYCALIKRRPIREITKHDVVKVLEPLWLSKHETARRVLGRVNRIMAHAIAHDIHPGPNPADPLVQKELLGEVPEDVKAVKHYKALDYAEMPNFFEQLQTWNGLAAKALTLKIFTVLRTSEVLGARWEEFDLNIGVWFVPGPRMKKKKPHIIPLSDGAIELLGELEANKINEYVFPSQSPRRRYSKKRAGPKPLSNMAMLELLKRQGVTNTTPHGMRACFRSWAHDQTSFETLVIRQSLAHNNPDQVDAAYLRSTAFHKRQQLMQSWCDYCTGQSTANIIIPKFGNRISGT